MRSARDRSHESHRNIACVLTLAFVCTAVLPAFGVVDSRIKDLAILEAFLKRVKKFHIEEVSVKEVCEEVRFCSVVFY